MQRIWRIKDIDDTAVAAVAAQTGLSSTIARLLVLRGVTTADAADAFLRPTIATMADPSLLKDMDTAVSRLVTAFERQEKVCIYGDYDVDGITATALLVEGLSRLGFFVAYHIPNRMDDGYGLSVEALTVISESGYQVAVSVDCGSTSCIEAAAARRLGLDLIITDHHQLKDELPDAIAVINPHRSDSTFPDRNLSGVGVAFMVLIALRRQLRLGSYPSYQDIDLRELLDLVALGTVADLVPLSGLNRSLVAAGLQVMNRKPRIGISALCEVARVSEPLSSGVIAFQLAPRLNAGGRLESAVPGVELLLQNDVSQARDLACQLNERNQERRDLERSMFQEAVSQVSADDLDSVIVLASERWHQGVVGIVASRLVERFHRPSIVLAVLPDGILKGSGRSIPSVHLLKSLDSCASLLLKYGGHNVAAGVTLSNTNLEEFKAHFCQSVTQQLDGCVPVPELLIDMELTIDHVSISFLESLEQLAPFGIGNPQPLFIIKNVMLRNVREFGDGHLGATIVRSDGERVSVVGWGMGDRLVSDRCDIVAILMRDRYRGDRSLKLELKDIRRAEKSTV